LKRLTWNWLLGEADRLRAGSALIVGDFNTAPGDSEARCGDCLEKLTQSGWQHARPASGYSWHHRHSGTERQIDHIFLSASLAPRWVEYSWGFERLAPEGTSGKVGCPDHAMLVCEFDQAFP
jgi:endonuclease/exonuclease/phosphatase family metal-dependent hydrolase